MDINFFIDGKKPDPKLGVVNGYIEEGINRVTFMELLTISDTEFKEEQIESMVGKSATLVLYGAVDGALQVSRFDGLIYEFHEPNPFRVTKDKNLYRLIVRPRIWMMNIGNKSRSFPDETRVKVIKDVLEESKLVKGTHFETKYYKESDYPKLSQILQCEQSDWAFIRKLMSEAGINFYFGAEKDGETEEMLHLVDVNAHFPQAVKEKIPWNPGTGVTSDLRIESFETQARAVPSSVAATAMFGDGLTRTFNSQESIPKGTGGEFKYYCVNGQEESVAKMSAKRLSQGFESLRVTYKGRSNHFLIRAGERIDIDGPTDAKKKKVLVTGVRHYVNQGADAAFGQDTKLNYSNTFTAAKEKAEIRPLPFKRVVDTRDGSARTLPTGGAEESGSQDAPGSLRSSASADDSDALMLTIEQINAATNGFGVMLGKVTEDAKVSDGKEMTCKIENERFPDGLTIKVAAPWLVPGGGVTSLPRVGMQVYFMLVQGEGGNHEAVMLGYRPSGGVPGLNPAKQTETAILKAGPKPELDKPGKPVVEKSSMSPSNRQRNALSGEEGVCEMAVIDGADATMSLSANNTISLTAKSDTNIASKNHMQMADVANEQFGELTVGVSGDCTESINGNHQFSLQGDQTMFVAGNITRTVSGDITEEVSGNKTGTVSGNRENTISGDDTETVSGNQTVTVSSDRTSTTDGNVSASAGADYKMEASSNFEVGAGANMCLTADSNLEASGGSNVEITAGAEMKISGTSKLELVCGGGSLSIDAAGNVKINGIMVDIVGSAPVSITGAMVKINS